MSTEEQQSDSPGRETGWRRKARRLAERVPPDRIHPRVRAWIEANSAPEPWAVACSGGADSLFLLLLLFGHFPERRPFLRVLHFNHGLRGEASEAEAARVEAVAADLGIGCRSGRWDQAPAIDVVTEEEARKARFRHFEEALAETGGRVLFLGHQRDDVAETLLMRLSRGSGTAGLAAPRPVQTIEGGRVHLRPLLLLGAAEIRQTLRALDIPWCEDASNRESRFFRNRIRGTVIPAWLEAAPTDLFAGAAASRELLEEDDEALETRVDELLGPEGAGPIFPALSFRAEPRAIRRRALNRWLGTRGLREHLNKRAFQRLLNAIESEVPLRCSAGTGFLVYDGATLRQRDRTGAIGRWHGEAICTPDMELHLPGGRCLRMVRQHLDRQTRARIVGGKTDPRREVFFDAAAADGGIVRVRPWRGGDRYHPLGAPGSRKLQDAFTDRRIDPAERRVLPVVSLDDGTIVWCPGLPPAEQVKIKQSTKQVVHLTYVGVRAT